MVGTPYNGYVFHSIHNRTKYLISARCPNRIRERLVLSSAAALGNLPARFAAVSPNSSACRLAGSAEHAYVFIFFHSTIEVSVEIRIKTKCTTNHEYAAVATS